MKHDLFQFKMEEGGDLEEHITQFNEKVNDLLHMHAKLDDEDKANFF